MDLMQVQPDGAEKIHQHQIGAAPADLHAEGIDRIRIEPHGDGGLSDPAAHRRAADEQPVGFERPHDDGGGLRR